MVSTYNENKRNKATTKTFGHQGLMKESEKARFMSWAAACLINKKVVHPKGKII